MPDFLLVFDHGTTGIRAGLMDRGGRFVALAYEAFEQIYPRAGWVEHDPATLWKLTPGVAEAALRQAGRTWADVAAIGLTNQRETTLLWDVETGEPVYNAIVWQCRRTAEACDALKHIPGLDTRVRQATGLVLDPYFSATKIRWVLEQVPRAQELARAGRLRFGTVDTWVLWHLSGRRLHATDVTNASRTLLYNIHEQRWDEDLLADFGVPAGILPRVLPSRAVFGESDPTLTGGRAIPLAGIAGDQQAALFGQRCWTPGAAKATYGTGAFLMMHLGDRPIASQRGLLTTSSCTGDNTRAYAFEGAVFLAGGTLEWLRQALGLIASGPEATALAESLPSCDGVYFVPAMAGLAAPYWDAHARGVIVGLSQASTRAHIARAALEAMAYQTREVLDAMHAESGLEVPVLKVDGGVTKSAFLCQFLADILQRPVERVAEDDAGAEATARGAAWLAGLATGFWQPDDLATLPEPVTRVLPAMSAPEADRLYAGWLSAVDKALSAPPARTAVAAG